MFHRGYDRGQGLPAAPQGRLSQLVYICKQLQVEDGGESRDINSENRLTQGIPYGTIGLDADTQVILKLYV